MGEVYLAADPDGAPCVLKFLAAALARDARLRTRFEREWAALQRVGPHPNVVGIRRVRGDADPPHIVLDYVAGTPLDQVVRLGPLAPALAGRVGLDLARGLAAVHARGLVHRDVKPANAILRPDDGATMVDFGLAKDLFVTSMTQPGQLMGTAAYMAPELWEETPADARADVFALGVTLYELLAGRRPFEGEDMDDVVDAVLAGEYDPLPERAPGAPPELALAIARMLDADPSRRYPTGADAARDLEAVLAGGAARVPGLIDAAGRRHPLLPGEFFTVGSDPGCEVPVEGEGVGPRHAQVRREGEAFVLLDFRSAGGTFVGDERLAPGKGRPLRDGDAVRVGPARLRFVDPGGARAAEPPAYLRDVARTPAPGVVAEALRRLGDPRAALSLLERLAPDPAAEARADAELAAALGPDAARAAGEARRARARARAAEAPERLRRLSGAPLGDAPAAWLAWWHQARVAAPAQVVNPDPAPAWRLRVVGGPGSPAVLTLGAERSVLLVGRDPRCGLRIGDARAARLEATVLRLDRRVAVVAEGGAEAAVQLAGAPTPAGFWDPGAPLAVGPLSLELEAIDRPPAAAGAPGPVGPASHAALVELRHPSVAASLVEAAAAAADPAAPRRATAPLEAGPALLRAVEDALAARAEVARRLLPDLLGEPDPERWRAALAARADALGPQVGPRGWA